MPDQQLIDNTNWQVTAQDEARKLRYLFSLKDIGKKVYPHYTHWVSGLNSFSFTNNSITSVVGRYREYNNSDRSNESWTEYDVVAQTVTLSAAQLQESILYITVKAGVIELESIFPTLKLLSDRLYLGVIKISPGAIAEVLPFLIEANPFNGTVELVGARGIKNPSFVPFGIDSTKNTTFPTANFLVAGSNFFADINDPHSFASAEQTIGTWDLYSPASSTPLATNQTELDFAQYYNGTSVINTNGADDATVRLLFFCPYRVGNKFVQVLGTEQYGNLNQCLQRWRSREPLIPPAYLGLCKLAGVYLGRKNFTNAAINTHVQIVANLDDFSSAVAGGATITDKIFVGNSFAGADTSLHEIANISGNPNPALNRLWRNDNGNWIPVN